MNRSLPYRILIIGAETVVGNTCAHRLAQLGYQVITTAGTSLPNYPFELYPMDVLNEQSVQSCIRKITKEYDRIDIIVNTAGLNIMYEDGMPLEKLEYQLEARFFAAIRVCKTILPFLQNQNRGLIIQAGGAGSIPSNGPLQDLYLAVQFTIQGMSEALNKDLACHNIQIVNLKAQVPIESLASGHGPDYWVNPAYQEAFQHFARVWAEQDDLRAQRLSNQIITCIGQRLPAVCWGHQRPSFHYSMPPLNKVIHSLQQAENKLGVEADSYMVYRQN